MKARAQPGIRLLGLLACGWFLVAPGVAQRPAPAASQVRDGRPVGETPRARTAVPGPPGLGSGIDVSHPDRSAQERPRQGEVGESPMDSTAIQPPLDRSAPPEGGAARKAGRAARPSAITRPGTLNLAPGTQLSIRLGTPVSSGVQHNGDTFSGTLAAPAQVADGPALAAGTSVTGTVVSSARAGTIQSGGVLSLELTQVGEIPVVTDVRSFDGRAGHRDVADSTAARGSEAQVPAASVLKFEVMR